MLMWYAWEATTANSYFIKAVLVSYPDLYPNTHL